VSNTITVLAIVYRHGSWCLTETQKGCTIDLKYRKTKYVSLEINKEYGQYGD